MALDLLRGVAQGIAGKALRKVAGNLPGLLGFGADKSGFSPEASGLSGTKFKTKSFQFPKDVISSPGMGNQGHYIMFFVNQQTNSKLGFGNAETDSKGKANLQKEASARKIPAYLRKLTSGGTYAQQKNNNGVSDQISGGSPHERNTERNVIKTPKSKGSTITVDRPATVRMDTAITLYMPQMVAASYGAQYQDEAVGDLAAAGANMYNEIMNSDKAALDVVNNGLKKFGDDLGDGLINVALSTLSIIPGIEGAKDVFFAQRGYIKAPKMELFFKGIGKRKFSYTFKMVPKSHEEMQEVRNIVASFKLNMLPEFVDGDRSSRRLTVPNTFDIQYMYNGAENEYLHKISTCVLETMDVKYSGEGKYQTFTAVEGEGAPPMVTELTLNFQEMEIMTKERVAEGF